MIVANAAALSAPVVLLITISVVVLLLFRSFGRILGVVLTREVSRLLDASIVVTFVLFLVLVVVRFKVIN